LCSDCAQVTRAKRFANVKEHALMPRIVAVTLASLLVLAAAPAAAQYGGSPGQQVDPPTRFAGKPGDQPMAVDPGAYDKDQAGDEADDRDAAPPPEAEGPPPPEAYDRDGPRPCRRSDGTTGAIVGGGAGALVGRGFDRHGERATGTIIGAVIGALIGHAAEQGSCR
jgi:hypothetical protein